MGTCHQLRLLHHRADDRIDFSFNDTAGLARDARAGLYEVIKRFIGVETVPNYALMIFVSALALIANAFSLIILQRTRSKEAHIQASIIFSSNDVIINLGVIAAGLLVMWLGTQIPDLVIGSIVFCIVISGAIRILSLAKK